MRTRLAHHRTDDSNLVAGLDFVVLAESRVVEMTLAAVGRGRASTGRVLRDPRSLPRFWGALLRAQRPYYSGCNAPALDDS